MASQKNKSQRKCQGIYFQFRKHHFQTAVDKFSGQNELTQDLENNCVYIGNNLMKYK